MDNAFGRFVNKINIFKLRKRRKVKEDLLHEKRTKKFMASSEFISDLKEGKDITCTVTDEEVTEFIRKEKENKKAAKEAAKTPKKK